MVGFQAHAASAASRVVKLDGKHVLVLHNGESHPVASGRPESYRDVFRMRNMEAQVKTPPATLVGQKRALGTARNLKAAVIRTQGQENNV